MAEKKINKMVKYPFGEMDVGDTFVIKCLKKNADKVRTRISCAANAHKRKLGEDRSYSTKKIIGGVEIERVG